MDTPYTNIAAIVMKFQIEGEVAEITPYGNGHINDTFLIKNKLTNKSDYLLQRINDHVFKNVTGLMNNIVLVTNHLQHKLSPKSREKLLRVVNTKAGDAFYQDSLGNYWRLYFFIAGSKSYNVAETMAQGFEAGRAFGEFQYLLSDMDPATLSETIANFHNIEKRLNDLYEAAKTDKVGRLQLVEAELEQIARHEHAMGTIDRWGQAGLISKRITHNDTKLNNVLFDENDHAICIIDLDTVMQGYVACDFGDAIRSIANTAAEDEPDLDKIQINVDLFEAYTEGYLKTAGGFLTDKEVESLFWGVLLLPYMQGVRFLTDYLDGDTYYKTSYADHNLTRTKAQLSLFGKLYEQGPQLNKIITALAANQRNDIATINPQLSPN